MKFKKIPNKTYEISSYPSWQLIPTNCSAFLLLLVTLSDFFLSTIIGVYTLISHIIAPSNTLITCIDPSFLATEN